MVNNMVNKATSAPSAPKPHMSKGLNSSSSADRVAALGQYLTKLHSEHEKIIDAFKTAAIKDYVVSLASAAPLTLELKDANENKINSWVISGIKSGDKAIASHLLKNFDNFNKIKDASPSDLWNEDNVKKVINGHDIKLPHKIKDVVGKDNLHSKDFLFRALQHCADSDDARSPYGHSLTLTKKICDLKLSGAGSHEDANIAVRDVFTAIPVKSVKIKAKADKIDAAVRDAVINNPAIVFSSSQLQKYYPDLFSHTVEDAMHGLEPGMNEFDLLTYVITGSLDTQIHDQSV